MRFPHWLSGEFRFPFSSHFRNFAQVRPRLESLEGRCLPANFLVLNTNDMGAGSLRQAIIDANATADVNTITFNISGSGVQSIALTSALPPITRPVTIDGKLVGADKIVAAAKATGKFDYDAKLEGLQALDRYTVQLKLTRPDYNLLDNMTHWAMSAVARDQSMDAGSTTGTPILAAVSREAAVSSQATQSMPAALRARTVARPERASPSTTNDDPLSTARSIIRPPQLQGGETVHREDGRE